MTIAALLPAIPARGQVYLTSNTEGERLRMTTDPEVSWTWNARTRVIVGLSDGVRAGNTTQQWGKFASDAVIELRWNGESQVLDVSVIDAFSRWEARLGETLRLEDLTVGDDLTVEYLGGDLIRKFGQPRLWYGNVRLHVLSIQYDHGLPYTGK